MARRQAAAGVHSTRPLPPHLPRQFRSPLDPGDPEPPRSRHSDHPDSPRASRRRWVCALRGGAWAPSRVRAASCARPPAAPARLLPAPPPASAAGTVGTYLPDKVTQPVRPGARPRVSGASERAGRGAVRRPPLLLSSPALSSSALLFFPFPSPPRRSPPCTRHPRPRLPRACSSAGLGAAAAARGCGELARGDDGAEPGAPAPRGEKKKKVRGDSRGARLAGWLGKGRPGTRRLVDQAWRHACLEEVATGSEGE